MKFRVTAPVIGPPEVAPRAGAWIEIYAVDHPQYMVVVAPRAGAWIEMPPVVAAVLSVTSLPVRERGLK